VCRRGFVSRLVRPLTGVRRERGSFPGGDELGEGDLAEPSSVPA
jgi:hypothetical protein